MRHNGEGERNEEREDEEEEEKVVRNNRERKKKGGNERGEKRMGTETSEGRGAKIIM